VADDFTMSDANIAAVQQRLPNRNGMTTAHAMWPGKSLGKAAAPDVKATACMHDCAAEPRVASLLPDFARNNNGNLAEQQRLVGPQRGADTTRPPGARRDGPLAVAPAPAQPSAPNPNAVALALLKKHACTACHGVEQKLVGPGFKQLAAKIKSGGQGVWGPIPMPAQTLPDADLKALAAWLATGAASR
jgi:cytochrome c